MLEIYAGGGLTNSRYFERATAPGWTIGLGVNQNARVRWTAEVSGQVESAPQVTFNDLRATFRQYQFLFGPHFTFRGPTVSPFVYGMAGIAARHLTTPSGEPEFPRDVLAVDFGFGSAFGGGLEAGLQDWLAIRVFQADYLLTHLAPQDPRLSPVYEQLPSYDDWQHSFRFTAGIVFKLSGN